MGNKNTVKSARKKEILKKGPLKPLHSRDAIKDAMPIDIILSTMYCENDKKKGKVRQAILPLYDQYPILRPLLCFWAFAAMPGGMYNIYAKNARYKQLKCFLVDGRLREILGDDTDLDTVGSYNNHSSFFVTNNRSIGKIVDTCLHEAMHVFDQLIAFVTKKNIETFTVANKELISITEKISKEEDDKDHKVRKEFKKIFQYGYSREESIEEILPRFFGLVARGYEEALKQSYPRLYQYVESTLNPFFTLFLLERGIEEHIPKAGLTTMLGGYESNTLRNIAEFVMGNVDSNLVGVRYLKIVSGLGISLHRKEYTVFPLYFDFLHVTRQPCLWPDAVPRAVERDHHPAVKMLSSPLAKPHHSYGAVPAYGALKEPSHAK